MYTELCKYAKSAGKTYVSVVNYIITASHPYQQTNFYYFACIRYDDLCKVNKKMSQVYKLLHYVFHRVMQVLFAQKCFSSFIMNSSVDIQQK